MYKDNNSISFHPLKTTPISFFVVNLLLQTLSFMAGIYIHIPFCKSRCIYCDFYSTTLLEERERYVNAICAEMRMRKDYLTEEIHTIYFGGGTPSLLSPTQLQIILDEIHHIYNVSPDAEITLEGNPDDLTAKYLQRIRELGFNRLSMGLQTFNDSRLRFLRRRHSAAEAIKAMENARIAGFGNISIDLMFGFPDQPLAEWQYDIEQTIILQPQHISAYSLMYEEGTKLTRMLECKQIKEIDEELSRKMYLTLIERLETAGYERYEISNFCKQGYHSRHNSAYWNSTLYIGIGAAAHSYNGRSRQCNPSSVNVYFHGIETGNPLFEVEELDDNGRYNETVMTGLRTKKGICLNEIERKFNADKRLYCTSNAHKHIEAGRLQIQTTADGNEWLYLTNEGLFVSDDIMSDLMY